MEVNGEEVFNGDGAAREASTRGKPSAEDLAAREEKKAAKKAANAQDRLKRSVSWRDDEQKGGDALVEVKEFRPSPEEHTDDGFADQHQASCCIVI